MLNQRSDVVSGKIALRSPARAELARRHAESLAEGVIEDREILKAHFESDGGDRQVRVAQQEAGRAQAGDADVCMRRRADDALEAANEMEWLYGDRKSVV